MLQLSLLDEHWCRRLRYRRAIETMSTGPGPTDAAAEQDADSLELEATRLLAAAVALTDALHEPGQRDRYRSLLEGAIDRATRALVLGAGAAARSTLVKAHTEKAEDALHGAGQLSLSAQRAPTL